MSPPLGLTPRPVWEYDGGILEWVSKLGKEVADTQFAFSPPIFLNERLLDDLVRARTRREQLISIVRSGCQTNPDLRAIHFEPRFSECSPAIGSPCAYLAACHNETINRDPIRSGLFVKRIPHHDVEILMRGGDDEQ